MLAARLACDGGSIRLLSRGPFALHRSSRRALVCRANRAEAQRAKLLSIWQNRKASKCQVPDKVQGNQDLCPETIAEPAGNIRSRALDGRVARLVSRSRGGPASEDDKCCRFATCHLE